LALALVVAAGALAGAPDASASAEAPAADPPQATIVFTSARSGERSIWLLGPRRGQLRRLTDPPRPVRRCACRFGERDSHAAWSADGRHVAFTRGARLFIVRAGGGGLRRVPAPAGAEDYEPAWSSRGRLAFLRQRPAAAGRGSTHEIVSVDRRGRAPRVLGPASRFAYRSFAWSSDGRRLAYAVPYNDPDFTLGLFVKSVPDGRPRFLLRAVGMGEITWSPDDRTLALAASVPGAERFDPYRLFALRLADRRIVQLTRAASSRAGDGMPRWAPDGRLIAFTRSGATRDDVLVVRPDGRRVRRLLADARGAAWSPDGGSLAVIEGVSGRGRPLALTTVAVASGARYPRVALRHPADADFLGAQSWRPR
jgi:Tol biopolymer transport system component